MKKASGIFIFYACGSKGIMLFFRTIRDPRRFSAGENSPGVNRAAPFWCSDPASQGETAGRRDAGKCVAGIGADRRRFPMVFADILIAWNPGYFLWGQVYKISRILLITFI